MCFFVYPVKQYEGVGVVIAHFPIMARNTITTKTAITIPTISMVVIPFGGTYGNGVDGKFIYV